MRGKIAHAHTPAVLSLSFTPLSPPRFLPLICPTCPNCPTSLPLPVILSPLRLSMLMDKQASYGAELPQWFRNGARWMKGWWCEREGREQSVTEGWGKNAGTGVPFIYLLFPSQNVELKKREWKTCWNEREHLTHALVIAFKVASPLRFAHERQIKTTKRESCVIWVNRMNMPALQKKWSRISCHFCSEE